MFIRSERLFLRPAWPEEWRETLAVFRDETIARNLAKAPWPCTAKDARDFVSQRHEKLLPHFFITLPSADGAKLLGSIGLSRDGEDIVLGYWISRHHWGRGYATEAARAVLGLARTLGHRRLVASHFFDNPASGRVLEKVGFTPTGESGLRYCPARDAAVLAEGYAIELDGAGNCDDHDPNGSMGSRRAA